VPVVADRESALLLKQAGDLDPGAENSSARPQARSPAARERAVSVDCLRGLVMILMALDHTRSFFSSARFEPADLVHTSPALFLTRWVTHFCAPVFFLLAGSGAFLSLARGRTVPEISRYLWTRGLWLVLLELTVVSVGWSFTFDVLPWTAGVIWALGWSMVLMAALVWLPLRTIAIVGLALIGLHNATDGVRPNALGEFGWLWRALHVSDFAGPRIEQNADALIRIDYPIVPWVGVMAIGYCLGPLLRQPPDRRRRILVILGGVGVAAFFVLRFANGYGDPQPWSAQPNRLYTALAFLRVRKYPPSLDFLLMTLGPSLIALASLERARGWLAAAVVTFGRVPLFFFVVHIYVAHALAVATAYAQGGTATFLLSNHGVASTTSYPEWYGFGLPGVYAIWLLIVVVLYPVCRWFAGVKARRRDWWLSYL
jgi:uncharacterized membrane protein